jgi:hypothetical protein
VFTCSRDVGRFFLFSFRTKYLLENQNGRDHSEDTGVDGRIILKWILGKWVWKVWIGFIWFGIQTGGWLL